MKKILALVLVIGFLGVSFAGGLPAFGELAALQAPGSEVIGPIEVPTPAPPVAGDRWWSVNFAGSAHKAIMKASLAFINKAELPDMAAVQDILLTGANDESGHLPDTKISNGGKPEDLWYGKTPASLGGVLRNYEHFNSTGAYARLGSICHLTQDMAVPTHAANIKHGINDPFEGYNADGNKVQIKAARDNGEMEPYAYYQDLQDDTRRHLASWVKPGTNTPYWIPAKDAPPLGQDATFGPWGSYGASYSERQQSNYAEGGSNDNQQISASPEIRIRQLAMAGAATVVVLRAASKRLPPLVFGLFAAPGSRSVALKFTILDNRSRQVSYAVSVFRDGALQSASYTGTAELWDPVSPELLRKGDVNTSLDISALPAGNYVLDARVTDADGNTTPDEVNSDEISANDTKAAVTIN